MAAFTIRNLSPEVIQSIKLLAQRNHRSMEQEVRAMLERYVGDRLAASEQIKRSWDSQSRSPSAREIDSWIQEGRR